MADNLIGGARSDLNVQNALVDAQARANQDSSSVNDDSERESIRKAAEKRLAIKQAGVQQQAVGETFGKKDASSALYDEAFSGNMGADVQRWAQDPKLQSKLTGAQKRLFLESIQARSTESASTPASAQTTAQPQAAPQQAQANAAAAAINRLASAPSFAQAVPTSRSMGELHQTVAQNPRLAQPLKDNVLDTRFMQSPKADAATKADFLRFGMQNMQKGNLQSVKVAGDMLGSLAGTQTPAIGQRAAMKMAQRDVTNEVGMKNVDGFVQQPEVRGMPSMARGRATEVLARADGDTDVRSGLESVAKDNTFSGLGREDKARVFSTIGQGRTGDFRAITDKVLQTLQSPDFPARQGQVSKLLTQLGTQVKQTGSDGVEPRTIIRAAKKSGSPVAPTLVSTASIDPEDEEAMTKARSQNRASVMKYYNQMAGSHDEIGDKLESAKYFEDVSMLSGLRPSEELDTSALDVTDAFRGQLGEQLETLKQGLAGGNQLAKKAQYSDQLKTLAQDVSKQLGRPLTTDEGTLVLVQSKQAQSELRFNDLTKQKNQRMRELRGQRMPPSKRQAQAAERRVVGEQPQYFSPGAGRAARGAFAPVGGQQSTAGRNTLPQGPSLGRAGQNQNGLATTQGPVLPRTAGLGQSGQTQRGQLARGQSADATGSTAQGVGRQALGQQSASRASLAAGATGAAASVEEEVAQLMASLDPSLSSAAKMGQARQIMADQLKRHIEVASQMMNQLMAEPGSIEQAAQVQQQVSTPRGKNQTLGQSTSSIGASAGVGLPTSETGESADLSFDAAPRPTDGSDLPDATSAGDMSQTGQPQQPPGAVGAAPSSLSAIEAISSERPRGAAAKLAAMVADASAAAESASVQDAGDMAKNALSALGVNLQAPGKSRAGSPQAPPAVAESTAPLSLAQGLTEAKPQTVQGKTDGWGIQRTFERDLGATGAPTVRAARMGNVQSYDDDNQASAVTTPEKYTGRTMVKSSTPVRDVATLQQTPWKQLTNAEAALLKNLGWAQKTWDTQTQPKTQWPRSMSTPYAQLSPKHREAVKRLGLSQGEWDDVALANGGSSSGGGNPR